MDEAQVEIPAEVTKHQAKPNRWAHYVFEFFMLFLAVTLGFFVENRRQKLSEREEEKQLVTTLLNDIKTDIKRADEIIQLRSERIEKNDSLYLLLSSPNREDQMVKIYEYMKNARSHRTLFYLSNTMAYLANGGFQRLRRNKVENETREYYLRIQDLLAAQQSSLDIGQELIEKSRNILDADATYSLSHPERNSKEAIQLFSSDSDQINAYSNALLHFNSNCGVQIQFLKKIKLQGEKLIESIKEGYDL